jgi:hypothetical protein
VLLVDPSFGPDLAPGHFTTIGAAMAAAAAGSTIHVAPGTVTENVTFSQDRLRLIGSGKPRFDGSNLVGGTLITGQVNMNGKNGCEVRSLGVDVRTFSGSEMDAILDNRLTPSDANNSYVDLAVLGVGLSSGTGHGILLSGGGKNTVRGCSFYVWYHGLALRGSGNIVSDCYFWACTGNSIIVKSATPSGDAKGNAITNCILDGDPANAYLRAGPIRVQSFAAGLTTSDTTILGSSGQNTGEAFVKVEVVAGRCERTTVSNCSCTGGGDDASRADFDVAGATDVHFEGCMSTARAAGYGFRVGGVGVARITAQGCHSDHSGAGRVSGQANFDAAELNAGDDKVWLPAIMF